MIKNVMLSLGIVIVILMILFAVVVSGVKTNIFSEQSLANKDTPKMIKEEDTVKTLPLRGEALFKSNCNSCHLIHDIVVGPALFDIRSRQSKEQIRKWIRNSQKLIVVDKDKYAMALFKKYDQILMPSFPDLTNNDIDDLISYIENCPVSKPLPVVPEVISCP